MSIEKMETSLLEIKDKISEEFAWDFKLPPHSRIKQNMTEVAGGGGFVFSDLKFTTGFLAEVTHQLIFAVYANQVNAYVILPTKCESKKYDLLRPAKLELMSQNMVKSTKDLKFTCDDMSMSANPHNIFATVWVNTDDSWDDTIDLMRLTIVAECHQLGETIQYANMDISRRLKLYVPPLELNASDMFLSKDFSDTTFLCGTTEFPVHRFLLACKSPVFKQMFVHDMKESKEGRVVIDDIKAEVLMELFRFIYCGYVSNMNDISADLFKAAEKYDIELLKNQCELALLQNLSTANALEMYMLADTYNGTVLKEKAVQMMKGYKSQVVHDAETFSEFTQRYPELMFQLYKL